MSRKKVVWIIVAVAGIALATVLVLHMHHWRPRTLTIQGAVIRKDEDTRKESPISDVNVIASDGVTSTSTRSDASGYFIIVFPEAVWPGQTLNLSFRHSDYKPLELKL